MWLKGANNGTERRGTPGLVRAIVAIHEAVALEVGGQAILDGIVRGAWAVRAYEHVVRALVRAEAAVVRAHVRHREA